MSSIVNFRLVLRIVSRILFIVAASMAICIGVAIYYAEPVIPFIKSSLIAFIIGMLLYILTGNQDKNEIIQRKDAVLAVTLSWVFIALAGCLTYLFSGAIPNFIDAFFESVSGFTTTGSSILTDIESLPKSVLFWRSLTHWIGGIGIIVLFIVIMPQLQMGGYNLFTLESSLQEKIQPRIKSVGIRLLIIYLILTVAEVILLMAGKMNLFESVCHAFGTVATGGFSPKNTSISDYSNYIQYVVMIFMLLGGTNFVIHYYLLKRDLKKINSNEELKLYISVILVLGIIISSMLYFVSDKPLEASFREGFFQVITIVTCTGYSTADYLLWPQTAWVILFLAMFLGGSTGSTAGGIKMARHLVVLKNIRLLLHRSASPNAVFTLRLNRKPVNEDTNNSILSFIAIYFLIFLIGSFSLVLTGIDGTTAAGSAATCMAGIGPGIGNVGPASNFASLPGVAKLILAFLMLLGRLEIYTVILLFTGNFWRK